MSCSRASGIDVGKYRVTGYDDFQVKNNTKSCWLFSYFVILNIKRYHSIFNIPRLAWGPMLVGPRATSHRPHALRRHCPTPQYHRDFKLALLTETKKEFNIIF